MRAAVLLWGLQQVASKIIPLKYVLRINYSIISVLSALHSNNNLLLQIASRITKGRWMFLAIVMDFCLQTAIFFLKGVSQIVLVTATIKII